jgi:hypothetical protein
MTETVTQPTTRDPSAGDAGAAQRQSTPDEVVLAGAERFLRLAGTWLAWDGRPRLAAGDARIYTPHKAVRRYADHLIDHLAQVEALLAGVPGEPDGWHGSLVTLDSDWARFTEADLVEANQRITRLAGTLALRLRTVGAAEWDRPRERDWSLRAIAEHVAPAWYAEQVGDLRSA